MSEKTRQFRSLLLEPLECRSVFSADGLEVWQFSQSSLRFEFDRFQPAQYPHTEAVSVESEARRGNDFGRVSVFVGVKYYERRSTADSSGFGSSKHRGRFNEAPLPPAESEAPSSNAPTKPLDSKTSLDAKFSQDSKLGLDLIHKDTNTAQTPTRLAGTSFTVPNAAPVGLGQSLDAALAIILPRPQVDSHGSESVDSLSASHLTPTIGASSPDRAAASPSQITTPLNSLAPSNNLAAQVNLSSASSPALSTAGSGTTTFDFSSQRSNILDKPRGVERASPRESLENLLSGLAENHRRNRMQRGLEVNQPSSSDNQDWRSEASASVEVTFADGGMIALALNRDIAMNELEELSEEARSENKAWIANVGIFRAFENGAVAATEYAGLNNRVTRNGVSRSSPQEVSEVEGEVANSHYHPLLASTSALLGVVMLGLRRMRRKNAPQLFTSRKQ